MNMSKFPGEFADEAKLHKLSTEVSRIATTLARLTVEPDPIATSVDEASANDGKKVEIPIAKVRDAIRARRFRYQFFDSTLFADPAWDMLLALFQAEIMQYRVPVSALTAGAAVPATTALRWIKSMTDADLFRRRADPTDARRVFVELSPVASEAMRAYFAKLDEGKNCA